MKPGSWAHKNKIQLYSILIMTGIALSVAVSGFVYLYNVEYEKSRIALEEMVKSQARIYEAIAKYDAIVSGSSQGQFSRAGTLSQIKEAHIRYTGFGETGELVLAEKINNEIVFLLPSRKTNFDTPPPLPLDSELALPMRLALSGTSGTITGKGHSGAEVLAAYEYLPFLEMGLAAEMDVSELRAPFIHSALYTAIAALLAIIIGAMLNVRIVGPLVSSLVDTTEKLQKVSQAVESSPASVVITDIDGNIEYVNPKFTTVTGYTSAEVIGKNPRVLNAGKQTRGFYEDLWGTITSGQEWHGEFCNRNKNGELYWETASISPIRDGEGRITHFVAVKEDVTERKAIEHELQHTNFLNDQALGLTKAGYWHVPFDGSGYYNSSERAVAIFGDIPNDDYRYRVMEDWFANVEAGDLEASKHTLQNFQDAIEGKIPAYDSIYAYKRPVDGSVVWIRAYGTVIRDSEGNATDMYGVTQDVTEYVHAQRALKLAKEAADDANQAKSTFLANMSHELRTPMNAILGYSEMLIEEAQDLEQEDFIPDLKKINQAGSHLLSLINDVLDLAKIEAGKIELFAEDIDIGGLLDEVMGTAEPLMAKNNNRIKLERDEHLGAAHQDLTKLRQSLYNLLSNAAKFTREGAITLQATRTKSGDVDWLTFTISDTGIGIPADKLGQVFEEFTQADGSTTRDYGGTGLGLAISRRFCRMMGGDITVRSQTGEGSAFTIRIPAIAPSVTMPKAPLKGVPVKTEAELDALQKMAPGCTVLVIDDDPEARDIIERFLKKDGFEVMTAASGEEGLRIAHRIRPAAITLDVMMPDMDGWSVLRALKADPDLHDIPVVMVTMVDDKTKGYSLGATDYLTKPVDRDKLLKILGRYHCADDVCAVLVVEDDENTRALLARTLEKEDWDVMQAGNGREALEQMSEFKPDLILLDLMMPVMDGFDFLLAMRGNPAWKDIPVIVVTAKDLTADDRRILSGKVEQVLEKGAYTQQQLLALVHSVVTQAETGQDTPEAV